MKPTIRRRIARAPPPTPIATGKGRRSAAVDDRVLTQYLETSLRVPDLAFPKPYPSKSPTPKTLSKVISLSSLVAGEDDSVGEMMSVAGEIGVFAVDAGDLVTREEVRALIEARREVAGSGEEKEMVLGEGSNEEAYRILRYYSAPEDRLESEALSAHDLPSRLVTKRDYSSKNGMWFFQRKKQRKLPLN